MRANTIEAQKGAVRQMDRNSTLGTQDEDPAQAQLIYEYEDDGQGQEGFPIFKPMIQNI